MNTGTNDTTPCHIWKQDVTLLAIRGGADVEIIAGCSDFLNRWYNAGEPIWMAAQSLTFVAKERARARRGVGGNVEALRVAVRAGLRGGRK